METLAKIALDKAIQELRKAMHLQMELCNRRDYDLDQIEQAGQLIVHCLNQCRMIMIPGGIEDVIRRRNDLQAIEVEAMIRRYGLDRLPERVDLADLFKLEPLPPIEDSP